MGRGSSQPCGGPRSAWEAGVALPALVEPPADRSHVVLSETSEEQPAEPAQVTDPQNPSSIMGWLVAAGNCLSN